MAADGPQERRHFAGDRGDDHGRLFTDGDKPAIAGAETDLSLPGNVTDGLRQSLEPGSQGLADAGGIAVGPSPFDQHAPGAPITGEREASTSNGCAGRALGGDQTKESHQLARIVETAHIADFRHKGYRYDEGDATHRLIGCNHRRHRPARHDGEQLLIETAQAGGGILDRIDGVLEDDLLRRVLELLAGEPTPMGQAPMLAAAEHPTMTKQERQQLLSFLAQIRCRCLARPAEVTNRLVDGIRHPDRRQLAGAKQPRKRHCVTPVGLDPLAGLAWDQRGRDNRAVMTQSLNLAVQPVPRWTSFVADMQRRITLRQLADQLLDRRRRAVDLAKLPDLTVAPDIGDRYRVLLLRRVKSDEGFAILLHGPPSVHETRLGPPEHPSYLYCTRRRTTDLSGRT